MQHISYGVPDTHTIDRNYVQETKQKKMHASSSGLNTIHLSCTFFLFCRWLFILPILFYSIIRCQCIEKMHMFFFVIMKNKSEHFSKESIKTRIMGPFCAPMLIKFMKFPSESSEAKKNSTWQIMFAWKMHGIWVDFLCCRTQPF